MSLIVECVLYLLELLIGLVGPAWIRESDSNCKGLA